MLTLVLIGVLLAKKKPALVELSVSTKRVAFDALPPAEVEESRGNPASDLPLAIRRTSLFAPSLRVRAMELREVDCIETTFEGLGGVRLQTEPGGSLAVRMEQPFHPDWKLNESTFLAFEVGVRDQVTVRFEKSSPPLAEEREAVCANPAAEDRGWTGSLPTGTEMSLQLREVRKAEPAGAGHSSLLASDTYLVPADATHFRVAGGKRDALINLALLRPKEPSTLLRVLDPATGVLTSSTSLPMALAESRSLPWRDRLVLLDPVPGGDASGPILRPDLRIRNLELARRVQLEAKSFVLGGEVRFPALEKERIQLDPGAFVSVSVDPRQPFTLRTLELSGDRLRLVLWGQSKSLRVGPTPELQTERLPSYFEWLFMQRLTGFVYATLVYVFTISFGFFKLLGWVKG